LGLPVGADTIGAPRPADGMGARPPSDAVPAGFGGGGAAGAGVIGRCSTATGELPAGRLPNTNATPTLER